MGSLTAVVINFFPFLTIEGLKIVMDNIIINAGGAKGGIAHSLTTLIPPKSDFYSLEKLLKFIFGIILLFLIFNIHSGCSLIGLTDTTDLFILYTLNKFIILLIVNFVRKGEVG